MCQHPNPPFFISPTHYIALPFPSVTTSPPLTSCTSHLIAQQHLSGMLIVRSFQTSSLPVLGIYLYNFDGGWFALQSIHTFIKFIKKTTKFFLVLWTFFIIQQPPCFSHSCGHLQGGKCKNMNIFIECCDHSTDRII